METLEISKENALKAFNEASEKDKDFLKDLFGKKVFVSNIMEAITSFEDALEYTGETPEQFHERTINDTDDEKAYKELKIIAFALNEGKHMDYKNTNEYKYYPWFYSAGSGSGFAYFGYRYDGVCSFVGARLCVDSSAKAKYMGTQFLSIYNRYING